MWPLVHMYRYIYLQGVNLRMTCWVIWYVLVQLSRIELNHIPKWMQQSIYTLPKRLYEFSLFYTPTSFISVKWILLWF